MKTVAEVMSHDVTSVAPDDSIRHAAELMDDLNVGALPVTAGQQVEVGAVLAIVKAESKPEPEEDPR